MLENETAVILDSSEVYCSVKIIAYTYCMQVLKVLFNWFKEGNMRGKFVSCISVNIGFKIRSWIRKSDSLNLIIEMYFVVNTHS